MQYTFDDPEIREAGEFYDSHNKPLVQPAFGKADSVIRARATKHGTVRGIQARFFGSLSCQFVLSVLSYTSVPISARPVGGSL